jgi:hypothetical protein
MRLVSLGLVLFFITGASANDRATKKCTKAEAMEAEKEIDSLKDWDQVYRSYNQFSQCDDGAIAEGYSELITRLLAEDWKSSKRLLELTNRSRAFGRFVLKHVDETAPADRLENIANNARSECPAGSRDLCLSIAKATGK